MHLLHLLRFISQSHLFGLHFFGLNSNLLCANKHLEPKVHLLPEIIDLQILNLLFDPFIFKNFTNFSELLYFFDFILFKFDFINFKDFIISNLDFNYDTIFHHYFIIIILYDQ